MFTIIDENGDALSKTFPTFESALSAARKVLEAAPLIFEDVDSACTIEVEPENDEGLLTPCSVTLYDVSHEPVMTLVIF